MSVTWEFCKVTGATGREAEEFIKLANGNLDMALSLFYEIGPPPKKSANE